MKREFLGDSYDAVKRMWSDMLRDWAPLYAEPRYIPDDLREDFIRLTGIPVIQDTTLDSPRSILNDPDTGIRLPGERNQATGRTHTTVDEIAAQLKSPSIRCVVTFDQSNYRQLGISQLEQRRRKIDALQAFGVAAFYYVSHAPFLFAVNTRDARTKLKEHLMTRGIPKGRFEDEEQKAEPSA